jgi:hypothetical protein
LRPGDFFDKKLKTYFRISGEKMKKNLFVLLVSFAFTIFSFAQNPSRKPVVQTTANAQLSAAELEKIEAEAVVWMAKYKAPALSAAVLTDNRLR